MQLDNTQRDYHIKTHTHPCPPDHGTPRHPEFLQMMTCCGDTDTEKLILMVLALI